jgi:hypothetical protein
LLTITLDPQYDTSEACSGLLAEEGVMTHGGRLGALIEGTSYRADQLLSRVSSFLK